MGTTHHTHSTPTHHTHPHTHTKRRQREQRRRPRARARRRAPRAARALETRPHDTSTHDSPQTTAPTSTPQHSMHTIIHTPATTDYGAYPCAFLLIGGSTTTIQLKTNTRDAQQGAKRKNVPSHPVCKKKIESDLSYHLTLFLCIKAPPAPLPIFSRIYVYDIYMLRGALHASRGIA
jgi:hypothetical protein